MELGSLAGLTQIIWLDVVLSGDNALVIGIAASTLVPSLRRKAIVFGLALATAIRILFAGAATYLLNVPGLLFAGGLALLWVSWRLFADLYWHQAEPEAVKVDADHPDGAPESHSLFKALVSITIADISMSIDNVLAVAAIARREDSLGLLVFGLALSIALMGVAATLIVRVLLKYRWISYVGVALLFYIAGEMLVYGFPGLLRLAPSGLGG
ncbi:MAG: YjbE family putative metal transport protein [Hyphomicrobiaceae bacterium]